MRTEVETQGSMSLHQWTTKEEATLLAIGGKNLQMTAEGGSSRSLQMIAVGDDAARAARRRVVEPAYKLLKDRLTTLPPFSSSSSSSSSLVSTYRAQPGSQPVVMEIKNVQTGGAPATMIHVPIYEPVPPPPLPASWPADFPVCNKQLFVPRGNLQKQLTDAFYPSERKTTKSFQSLLLAEHGLGGIGKTKIAAYYAQETAQIYPLRIWFHAESQEGLNREYRLFCNLLDSRIELSEQPSDSEVIQAVTNWLATNPGWLVIYDNAPDYETVQPYLPLQGGNVLITSRSEAWPAEVNKIKVGLLTKEEAEELIKRRIFGDKDAKLDDKEAAALVQLMKELDYLPLALAQAAAYIAKSRTRRAITIADYLALYQSCTDDMLDKHLLIGEYPKSVAKTWLITMQQIQEQSLLALQILNGCAYLAANEISPEIIKQLIKTLSPEKIADEKKLDLTARDVTDCLCDYSMLDWQPPRHEMLGIHQLVQQVSRSQTQFAVDRPVLVRHILKSLTLSLPRDDKRDVAARRRPWLVHFSTAFAHFKAAKWLENPTCAQALDDLGTLYVDDWADGRQGIHYLEQARAIIEPYVKLGFPSYPFTKMLTTLSIAYGLINNHQKKRDLLIQAWELIKNEKAQGAITKEHIREQTVKILIALANAEGQLGNPAEKRDLLKQAVGMWPKKSPDDYDDIAATITINLANAYGDLGEHKQQRDLLNTELPGIKKHFGDQHPRIAAVLHSLGIAQSELGEWQEARHSLEQALTIKEDYYGYQPPLITTLTALGRCYLAFGQYQKACIRLEQALLLEESLYGEDHLQVALTCYMLGDAYGALGNCTESIWYFERVLLILKSYPELEPVYNDASRTLETLKFISSLPEREQPLKIQNIFGPYQEYKQIRDANPQLRSTDKQCQQLAVALKNLTLRYEDLEAPTFNLTQLDEKVHQQLASMAQLLQSTQTMMCVTTDDPQKTVLAMQIGTLRHFKKQAHNLLKKRISIESFVLPSTSSFMDIVSILSSSAPSIMDIVPGMNCWISLTEDSEPCAYFPLSHQAFDYLTSLTTTIGPKGTLRSAGHHFRLSITWWRQLGPTAKVEFIKNAQLREIMFPIQFQEDALTTDSEEFSLLSRFFASQHAWDGLDASVIADEKKGSTSTREKAKSTDFQGVHYVIQPTMKEKTMLKTRSSSSQDWVQESPSQSTVATAAQAASRQPVVDVKQEVKASVTQGAMILSQREIYRELLKKLLKYEIEFLINVVNGSAEQRRTKWDVLKDLFVRSVKIVIPFVDGGEIAGAILDAGEWIYDHVEQDKEKRDSLVYALLTLKPAQWDILIQRVAEEASCYWDEALTHWLTNRNALLQFSLIGAQRIVDFLCKPGRSLDADTMLMGLVEGVSGKEKRNFFSEKIQFDEKYPFHGKKTSVEGLYSEAGYMTPEGKYYIHADPERQSGAHFVKLMSKEDYVKFMSKGKVLDVEPNSECPKYAYLRLPNRRWVTAHTYERHTPDDLWSGIMTQKPQPGIIQGCRWVTIADIKEYKKYCQEWKQKSAAGPRPPLQPFNNWLGYQAFFRDILIDMDLSDGDFSKVCFNGATFRNCTLGSMKGAHFIEATWNNVTVVPGSNCDDVCLDGATLQRSTLEGLTPVRFSMRYAQVVDSHLAGFVPKGECHVEGTTFDESSRKTLDDKVLERLAALERQMLEMAKRASTLVVKRDTQLGGIRVSKTIIIGDVATRVMGGKDLASIVVDDCELQGGLEVEVMDSTASEEAQIEMAKRMRRAFEDPSSQAKTSADAKKASATPLKDAKEKQASDLPVGERPKRIGDLELNQLLVSGKVTGFFMGHGEVAPTQFKDARILGNVSFQAVSLDINPKALFAMVQDQEEPASDRVVSSSGSSAPLGVAPKQERRPSVGGDPRFMAAPRPPSPAPSSAAGAVDGVTHAADQPNPTKVEKPASLSITPQPGFF